MQKILAWRVGLCGLLLAALAHAAQDEAHLVVADAAQAKARQPALLPATCRNVTVFEQPGRYGGWPANQGAWIWGDELVVGFTVAWFKHAEHDHAVDRSKPFEKWQARSTDGGATWTSEKTDLFTKPVATLPAPLDFTQPDFALMFQFGNMHAGPSWFFVSTNRCHAWSGPYAFAVAGIEKITARTDLIVLGPRDCLMFGSAAKANGKEGRAFCARTADGGMTWRLVSIIGPAEPPGYSIMPSSLRLKDGAILTTLRRSDPGQPAVIEAYRSADLGAHWEAQGAVTGNIGGNPPSLVALRDGRLALTYGYRLKPSGARARISGDEGRTWGPEIILRADGASGDLGYPRSVVRSDGKIVTLYYFNGPRDEDRTIQASIWTPPTQP